MVVKLVNFMQRDEGINLVAEAICSGIFNDLGSGSNVDVCVITKVCFMYNFLQCVLFPFLFFFYFWLCFLFFSNTVGGSIIHVTLIVLFKLIHCTSLFSGTPG